MKRWSVLLMLVVLSACETDGSLDALSDLGKLSGASPSGVTLPSWLHATDRGRCLYIQEPAGDGFELRRNCSVDGDVSFVVVPPDWKQTTFDGPVEEVPDVCLVGVCVEAAGGQPSWLWVEEYVVGGVRCETRIGFDGMCSVCWEADVEWVPCAWKKAVWGYYPIAGLDAPGWPNE